jgi:hypothetical protein
MRTRLVALAFLSFLVSAAAVATHGLGHADDVDLTVDVDTLGLQCNGDSAPAIVHARDAGGTPVAGHEVTFGFIDDAEGVVTDPLTGAAGARLTGTTDASGEWHVNVAPTSGLTTSVRMVVGDEGGPEPFTMACPFPDDDAYSLSATFFADLDRDGRRGARERNAYRVQVGLAATGCCNFGQQIPPHWEVTRRNGVAGWNGLSQDELQIWKICLPHDAAYRIVSVNGTAVEEDGDCQSLPALHEGRNRATVGIAAR